MDLTIIQNKIYEIRGERVMLDRDLAELYQVETRILNQAVKRNIERFPDNFMFELSTQEANLLTINLRSQIVTSNRGGNRYSYYAFTEQGVAMLSAVLRSPIAIQVSINIMNAFVAMRRYLLSATTQNKE
ncbi:MAG: ORF6N domain-containing protein, partial [Bacteroidales bacterium]